MKASDIILESVVCKQASINIYPEAPDELFNECWLSVREKEIKSPHWQPKYPKHYFLRMMKNKACDWKKRQKKLCNIDKVPESNLVTPITYDEPPFISFVIQWCETPTDNENDLFLKNILTLAVYTKITSDAIKMTGISRKVFYHYLKIAKQKLYDDYHASNPDHVPSAVMV